MSTSSANFTSDQLKKKRRRDWKKIPSVPTRWVKVRVRIYFKDKHFGFLTRGPDSRDVYFKAKTARRARIYSPFKGQWLLVKIGRNKFGLIAREIRRIRLRK